ncbi:MAG: BON domain-containing protein [Bacteroidota bacterium]
MFRSMNFYRGLILGAVAMYLLDPEQGRTRRAALRDRASGALHDATDFAGKAGRDLRNRAAGTTARAAALGRPDHPDDRTLAERVRAQLGRYVSHPRAVHVDALGGTVTLAGPILRDEAEELIGAVSSVRGVEEVLNRLEPHDAGEGEPALAGPGRREEPRSRRMPLTPGLQLVAGVIGAGAMAYGASRIVRRVRDARREELEREMPEYAMLR